MPTFINIIIINTLELLHYPSVFKTRVKIQPRQQMFVRH